MQSGSHRTSRRHTRRERAFLPMMTTKKPTGASWQTPLQTRTASGTTFPRGPQQSMELRMSWGAMQLDCQGTLTVLCCRDHRPASGSQMNSFSFGGHTAGSAAPTPQLPGPAQGASAGAVPGAAGGQDLAQEGAPEVEGPQVMCHCGLPCNKLEARTERNAGRSAGRPTSTMDSVPHALPAFPLFKPVYLCIRTTSSGRPIAGRTYDTRLRVHL